MKRKGNLLLSNLPNKKTKGDEKSVSLSAFLTPSHSVFSDLTDEVIEQVRISGISSGMCAVTSLNHACGCFMSLPDSQLHKEILGLIGDLCPKKLKFKHPDAEMVMKHYVLKKEVVLSINKGTLQLNGERIFFHDFETRNTEEEYKKQVCLVALGVEGENDPFPSKVFSRTPSRSYFLENVSRKVNRSLGRVRKFNGHCLVSSISPETTIFINDDEGGLHRDYNNWQTKFTKKYKYKNQLKRVMMGREVLVSINGGALDFGTWEQIFDGSFGTIEGEGGFQVKAIGGAGLKYYRKVLQHHCKNRFHPTNITQTVNQCVKDSGMMNGICLVNSMHITSGCFVGVDDQRLLNDFFTFLEFVAPEKPWENYNHNGYAHHKRQIMSRSVVIPIIKGEIVLGDENYSIFYGECDGQRTKRQLVTIIGV